MLLLRQTSFVLTNPIQISEAPLYINDQENARALRVPEKVLFLRLLKNAQMQVESAKSRLRGRPCLRPARRGYAQAGEIPCRECIYAFPTVLQRLALLDNTLAEFRVYQVL
jgi:hypothetical protein